MDDERTVARLLATLPQVGRVAWIGAAPARRAPVVALAAVDLEVGAGLAQDHHAGRRSSKRQVTLVQAEHLPVVAACLGLAEVRPEQLRRNVVVAGVNLLALEGRRFRLGGALLEATGPCDPCSRMEETLGPGGYNAMRGHGGITARVLEGGRVRVGDRVRVEPAPPEGLGRPACARRTAGPGRPDSDVAD